MNELLQLTHWHGAVGLVASIALVLLIGGRLVGRFVQWLIKLRHASIELEHASIGLEHARLGLLRDLDDYLNEKTKD